MGARSGPRSTHHQGRVTAADDEPMRRQPRRAVTVTAWLIVVGLALAVIGPVLAIVFG